MSTQGTYYSSTVQSGVNHLLAASSLTRSMLIGYLASGLARWFAAHGLFYSSGLAKWLAGTCESAGHTNETTRSSGEVEYLERETLTHVLPTVQSVILSLPKETTITEPTFKDVVLVYFDKKADGNSLVKLKSFCGIPMADLEVVLPHKQVNFQPKDKISLLVAAVMTCIAVIKAHFSATTSAAMVGVIVILASKMFQMFQNMRKMKADTIANMVNSLYVNSRDEGQGVIHRLIDSSEEQDVKEILLAYCMLLKHGQLTENKIVKMCEEYISNVFSTAISFEGDDALAKLIEMGLARSVPDGKGSYVALPLTDAISMLEAHLEQPPVKRQRIE